MIGAAVERVFRSASGRIVAALAVRFHDLALAEDAFAESCLRALRLWPERGVPSDPAAWLYRVSQRVALDILRQRTVREHNAPDAPAPSPNAEDLLTDDAYVIPDERLRLIFICCHPSVAPETRAALTLRCVCGLSVIEIARAFLVQETTLAQRLVRAKRKISNAGVPFELPSADLWPERMEAVLCTLEIAYAKAHEDASATGTHAGFAVEAIHLTRLLCELAPSEGDAFALAALVRYAEARRPARVDESGAMVPLSEQDPRKWRRDLIDEADILLAKAITLIPDNPRTLQAKLQQVWCARGSLDQVAPWPQILAIYDGMLAIRDDVVVRLNRVVALSEVGGPDIALAELERLPSMGDVREFLPYHAVRADLLRRVGRMSDARTAYCHAIALDPAPAERLWLEQKLTNLIAFGGAGADSNCAREWDSKLDRGA